MIVMLISCGGTTRILTFGSLTKNETYKINSYYGCCGCEAKYFTISVDGRKMEQVIYSYNCSAPGKPTKFIFNYNKHGRLVSCDRYIATTTNDFAIQLSEKEKELFSLLEKDSLTKVKYSMINFSDVTGFRKPYDKETVHSFPLIKKGYKLKVRS
ncbi:MAG: hypothetical protein QM764_03045 [Chitinophagaceae bacterium]